MAKKQYTLVLNFGYVESSRLAFMPWTSKQKFNDAKEALVDLATFLKERYMEDHKTDPKKCCLKTKEKDPEAVYCSKCRRELAEAEFDGEEFIDWLRSLDTDVDTFHGYIEWDPEARWQADAQFGPPQSWRFIYQAEWVLAAAIGHPIREEITFEKICKERTKSKTDSFTYY